MIGVITDLLQSTSIIVWCIIFFFLSRRLNRLESRSEQRITYQIPEAGWKTNPAALPPDPQPICGCEHHQCFHDETGCHKEEIWQKYDSERYVQPCGCKRYTGPEPLPTVIP